MKINSLNHWYKSKIEEWKFISSFLFGVNIYSTFFDKYEIQLTENQKSNIVITIFNKKGSKLKEFTTNKTFVDFLDPQGYGEILDGIMTMINSIEIDKQNNNLTK